MCCVVASLLPCMCIQQHWGAHLQQAVMAMTQVSQALQGIENACTALP